MLGTGACAVTDTFVRIVRQHHLEVNSDVLYIPEANDVVPGIIE